MYQDPGSKCFLSFFSPTKICLLHEKNNFDLEFSEERIKKQPFANKL